MRAIIFCLSLLWPGLAFAQDLPEFKYTAEESVELLISQPKTFKSEWKAYLNTVPNSVIPSPPRTLSDTTPMCIAQTLYHEARGETLRGQFAVITVLQNRAKADRWKDEECDVIQMKSAISALSSQKRFPPFAEKEAWKSVWLLTNLLHGHTYPGMDRADHYHTTSVSPSWSRKMTLVKKIGVHKFYADPATSFPVTALPVERPSSSNS